MEQDGFSWWKNRIRKSASLYDVIRIDHFIGVVRYYNIPADGEPKNGFYLEGPGKKLVDAIDSARGNAKVIAEDLGVVVPEVQKLVKESGYPGMKILRLDLTEMRRMNMHRIITKRITLSISEHMIMTH